MVTLLLLKNLHYNGVFTRLKNLEINIETIPVEEDGMDLSILEKISKIT